MLRIVQSTAAEGAKRYFDDALARGDYYIDGEELVGSWGGNAASMLGLDGEVSREEFHQLCDNINPATGKRLTARNRAGRRIGYDLNFHCPKTVSAVYALTQDERILEAFRASVRETMVDLERDTQCRVRDKGQFASRTTGNMVWGEFVHLTTRPVDGVPDPHLHAHCFVFNATWDGEHPNRDGSAGMWKAGDIADIKRDGRYFEAAFHSRFAGRMARMGYPVERDGKGFWDIAGIPSSVRDKYSRRTQEIEALAQELGIVDPKALDRLGAQSRQVKGKGKSLNALRRTWDGWLTPEERRAIHDAQGDADGTARPPAIRVGEALTYGIDHLFERRSAVSRRELAETALRHGVGAVSVAQMWQRTECMEQTGALVRGSIDDREMVTTRRVLGEEREMLAFARDGRGACAPLGRADYVFTDPLFHDAGKDTAEQQAAIRQVLGSHDRVIAIRGAAGTGKTTLMREVAAGIREGSVRSPLSNGPTRSALRDGGHRVYAFAPTAEASRGVLRREGFESADTVARLLMDQELQQEVRGQVIWIDEAGLLGARALNAVFRIAKAQGCRVILSGDTKQHHSVPRGDAMRVLEEYGGVDPVAITKIQRQRVHTGPESEAIRQYRQAVKHLSEGKPARGYELLDRMGAVVEFDIDVAPDERYRQIADDYLEAVEGKNRKGRQNHVLAVSPTHAEGNAVTEHIRKGLRQAGRIGRRDRQTVQLINLNWTEAERGDAARYQPGQVIQFHQNVQGGFGRGSRWTVIGESFNDVQAPLRLRASTALVVASGSSVGADERKARGLATDGSAGCAPLERNSKTIQVQALDGTTRTLPLSAASRFSVYEERSLPLAEGDRIRITQNGYTLEGTHRLNNGALHTVAGFTRKGDIRLDNGWVVDAGYGHLSHGYVTTSHASQGKSVDVVLIAQSAESLGASSLEQFYVSVSRGKERVRIYTGDKDALASAIRRSGKRVSATELTGSTELRSGTDLLDSAQAARSLRSRRSLDRNTNRIAPGRDTETTERGTGRRDRERTHRYRQVIARRRDSINQRRRIHERDMDRG